jgi:hypothetical protein
MACADGYTLNGNAFVSCQADGNWSTLPVCDIKSKAFGTITFQTLRFVVYYVYLRYQE